MGYSWSAWLRSRGGTASVLVLVVGVGGVVRVWALGEVGFNSDEAVYAGQAAALARDPALTGLFPMFRAHPLLFQAILSLGFSGGVSDTGARVLSVVFGLSTVAVMYPLGERLYGRKAGLVAAFFLAVMPYHVVVTRQVLLDGPETFFTVVALYCVVRFCLERAPRWLHAAAAILGLAVLTKETAVVLVVALFVFFVLRREFSIRLRDLLIALGVLAMVVVAYPLSLSLSGRTGTGQNYLVWQLLRRANHGILFYGETVLPAIGPALLALAAGGLWLLRGQSSWREWLLLCWLAVPLMFFQLWPVKGYQYLLPATPVLAVLAARAGVQVRCLSLPIRRQPRRKRVSTRRSAADRFRLLSVGLVIVPRPIAGGWVRTAVVLAVGASLAVPAWLAVHPAPSAIFLAGTGGVPGGREAGEWIGANLPGRSRVLTIGPSMANLVRFYGRRRAFALSVSPNPLSRNPSYEPVDNPDRELRHGDLQYVVWDAFSAARTPFFGERLMRYVHKYHGFAVHTETIDVTGPDGRTTPKPVIAVYEVRP